MKVLAEIPPDNSGHSTVDHGGCFPLEGAIAFLTPRYLQRLDLVEKKTNIVMYIDTSYPVY